MARNARCETDIQEGDERRHKFTGLLGGAQERNLILLCKQTHFLKDLKIRGDNDADRLCGKEIFQTVTAFGIVKLLQIEILNLTDDLQTRRLKVVKKADKRQTGAVDLRG